jgi:antitoxin component of MazEF toxin-antitoxin module
MKKIVRGKEISRRVIRQGNSLMVTIPSAIVQNLSIREGDPIEIEDDGTRIIIVKKRPAQGGDT